MIAPVIVASGGANLASLKLAIERLGYPAALATDPDEIRRASHVILPGVGAAAEAMARLDASGLATMIPSLTQPVLGICLGMQLLYESSDEGDARCLGVFQGRVRRMTPAEGRPVPHMGWNRVSRRRDHTLLADIADGEFAYFVHSYCARLDDAAVASCTYDGEFPAIVCRGNFCGAQFHPERSAAMGSRFLANFLEWS